MGSRTGIAGRNLKSAAGALMATIDISATAGGAKAEADRKAPEVAEVVVTASTHDLLGIASTSSQGSVTRQEMELRPTYRVGQIMESVPGLVVTAHSGEGKANQYLLRGFNLDHGTDLATYVDSMPVNARVHAHGQGYTDLNFLIPELATGLKFTKGPYYASEGDFASVGSNRVSLTDSSPTQTALSAGSVHDQRLFATTTFGPASARRLLVAAEAVHLDGPWDTGDNFRKINLALRLSPESGSQGVTLTGLYYRGAWNATTDQPARAIAGGLISRFGTLDPSDGGHAERFSLSATYLRRGFGPGNLDLSAYAIRNQLTLYNNFTHYLVDPVAGDQHAQNDRRLTLGGEARYILKDVSLPGGLAAELELGAQSRRDQTYVDARHSHGRTSLETLLADNVTEWNLSTYVQTTVHAGELVRAQLGARLDHFEANDHNIVGGLTGREDATLVQPKASLILGPWDRTELYLNAGEGFHSNDVRAGLSEAGDLVRPPFLAKSKGSEIGVRTRAIPKTDITATLFKMEFASELTYNADEGRTEAGRPGRRIGIELAGQYRPYPWIELNTNVAISRARYTDNDPAGPFIEDAPEVVASAGLLIDNLGPWFGAAEFRDLGAHALRSDNSIRSRGYREINLSLGYKVSPAAKVQIEVFNITNSKDDAADYVYTDRLPGEPASGVEDLHIHPLEPTSFRLALSRIF